MQKIKKRICGVLIAALVLSLISPVLENFDGIELFGVSYVGYVSASSNPGQGSRPDPGPSPQPELPVVSVSLKAVTEGVNVSWNALSGASKYVVKRKYAGEDYSDIATVTSTSFLDKNAKPNKEGTYTVVALNSSGSAISKVGDGSRITFIIAAIPVNVKYKAEGVSLNWKSIPQAGKYRIQRKIVGSGADWKAIKTVKSLNYYVDNTVVFGKTYSYRVVAMSAGGAYINEYGPASSIKYTAPIPKVTVENTAGGIQIKTAAMKNANQYRIFYKGNGKTSWTKLTTMKNGQRVFVDEKAVGGQTYTYTVVGMDKAGHYMNEYGSGVSIKRVVPDVNFALTSVGSGVKITWGAIGGAGKYRVFRKKNGEWDALGTVKTGEPLQFKDTTAKDGKTYTYTVVAMTSGGKALTKYVGKSITYHNPLKGEEVLVDEITTDGVIIISEPAIIEEDIIEDIIEEDAEEETEEDAEVIEEDPEEKTEEDAEVIEEDSEEIEEDAEEETEEDAEAVEEDAEEETEEDAEAIEEDAEEEIEEDAEAVEEDTEAVEEDAEEESGEETVAEEEEAAEEVSEEIVEE